MKEILLVVVNMWRERAKIHEQRADRAANYNDRERHNNVAYAFSLCADEIERIIKQGEVD